MYVCIAHITGNGSNMLQPWLPHFTKAWIIQVLRRRRHPVGTGISLAENDGISAMRWKSRVEIDSSDSTLYLMWCPSS